MRRVGQTQRRIGLVFEVLWTYVLVRAAMAHFDVKDAVAWLRATCRHSWRPTAEAPDRHLSYTTVRVLSWLPTDSRCLMRSLVLVGVLARRGIDSTLVIGVRPGETFAAHAWVERGPRELLSSHGDEFSRLLEL